MSTMIISPVVVVDTSSANPQIVEQSAGTVGVATSVMVV
jgi:hypothetical protein